MSLWQTVVIPAVSGAGGISGFGAFIAKFIKGQAEGVVKEAIKPVANDVAELKTDVAYIKGKVGISQ